MSEPSYDREWELDELAMAYGDEFKDTIAMARSLKLPCEFCAVASWCVLANRCAKKSNEEAA